EVITHHYTQNIDLKDAKTVLSNSGTAIMGSATAEGEDRARQAISSALDSPLLNDNKISGAKNVLLLIVSGTNEITIDEIGEINDYIQSEAGHSANIIMGVGEDESLGDAIAVTVIATGFNAEQQNEIVNTEPKKIIHSLDNESKMEQNLLKKEVTPLIDFSLEQAQEKVNTIANTIEPQEEEKIVFSLEEEETEIAEEPKFEIFETDLIPTSEFIKNLDVVFEIVPAKSTDFTIATPAPIKEEEIAFEVKTVTEEVHEERNEFLFDISAETKEMKVNDPIRVVPVTEVSEAGITRFSLEEYMEVEKQLMDSKPKDKTEEVPAELKFTLKQETPTPQAVKEEVKEPSFKPSFEELPATEMTIEEALKARADERRRKMKEFNYKFHNSVSRIEEIEKVPAYKRQNIDLSQNESINGISRTSLSTDSNNDLQLRNNNSFLHDNVD